MVELNIQEYSVFCGIFNVDNLGMGLTNLCQD